MYCCVPFCKSSRKIPSHNKISFHEFPVHGDFSRQWLRRIARKDFVPNDKSNSSVVCSKHFTPEDFLPQSKYRRLKKGAIPTVFPMYPSYALLSPTNNSSSLATLNHDHVKKPPWKKNKRKNSRKEVDPSIPYNFEMNSTNNKSPDQHNEDRVVINEEDEDQYDSSRLLQTLNHLKLLSTENSTKKVTTGIASNSDMTFTNNNSPKPPGVVHAILINEGIKDTASNISQSIANSNQMKIPFIEESSTEKDDTGIDFGSDMISKNYNSPEQSVHAIVFNKANKDASATKNSNSLGCLNRMKRPFIMVNESETSTVKDGSGMALDSDLNSTNNNLPEQSNEVHMLTINELKKDHPASNNCHPLVSLNHQKTVSVSVSETENLTVKYGSGMTFINNNHLKQPSVVGVCMTNVAKKDLLATNNRHSLIGINPMKRLSIKENRTENLTKKYDTGTTTNNSSMLSKNKNLSQQKKVNRVLPPHNLMQKCVLEKNREIKNLRSLLSKKDQELKQMKEEIGKLEEKVSVYESNDHFKILRKKDALKENSPLANFNLDQMDNFLKKRPSWRERTIRERATTVSVSVSETENLTLKYGSGMSFTNNNSPKQPTVVSACTINVAKKDLPATKNRSSLIGISHRKRLSTEKNITENSTKKDDTSIPSKNKNLSEQKKKNRVLTPHDLMQTCVLEKNREIGNLRTLLLKKDKELKKEISKLEEKVSVYESNNHHKILRKIGALKETSPQSNFILDQMDNFYKKQPTWRESTIRECATWIACSPQGYDFVRERKLMVLPSRKTLLKYAYSGEIKMEIMDSLSSCQAESRGPLSSENSAMEH